MSEYDKAMTAALEYQRQLHELSNALRPLIDIANMCYENPVAAHSVMDCEDLVKSLIKAGEVLEMKKTEIDWKQVRITAYHPSEPSGSKWVTGRIGTCVRLVHIPTGIVVFSEDGASQRENLKIAKEKLKIILEQKHD